MITDNKFICSICGKTANVIVYEDDNGNKYVNIQDKVWIKLKSFKALYKLCEKCTKKKELKGDDV